MSFARPRPGDHVYDPGDMAALPFMTNIDRRTCKREVPMRVLCLGLSRTGTVSLRQALVKLGYIDCYHYTSVFQENPRDAEMWTAALLAKFHGQGKQFEREQWDQLLGHCQAVTDTPAVYFYQELLAAYPDAKVVLTERDDVDQWFKSMMNTIIPFAETQVFDTSTLSGRIGAYFSPVDTAMYDFNKLVIQSSKMHLTLIDDHRNGTEAAKQLYLDYNTEIRRLVPKERLLVFNVRQGWEPLCEFLDEEVPGEEFPRRNEMKTFKSNVDQMGRFVESASRMKKMKVLGSGLAVLVGVVAVGTMFVRRGSLGL